MASTEAHPSHARAYRTQDDSSVTERTCRELLAKNPNDAAAHLALAQVLALMNRRDAAIQTLNEAIDRFPSQPGFYAQLGNLLADSGCHDKAIEAHRKAVSLAPMHAALHYNLGNALKARGNFREAADSYHAAIRLNPKLSQAHINLGNVLLTLNECQRAVEAYSAGLELAPNDAIGHNNLGNAYQYLGRMENAKSHYRNALRINPEMAEAWNNLADVCLLTGELDEALASAKTARTLAPDAPLIFSNYISLMKFHPAFDDRQIKSALDEWRRKFADPLCLEILPHDNTPDPERPLRIGYVSPDFHDHVVGRNLVPIFRHYDRARFQIYCYAEVAASDQFTAFFRGNSDRFTCTSGMSDDELATTIRNDHIDILVDLTLHQSGSKLQLFARKPAPIQVTFAGYPGSTGLTTIDYRVTDPGLDPPGVDESVYSEKSIWLESFWCYDPADGAPDVGPLPALTSGCFTFGCLNNFCKVNTATLALWGRVFKAVPNARLLLLAEEGMHRERVHAACLEYGFAYDQVQFVSHSPHFQYLEHYHHIDLTLDTLPYNGHTTTLDSLYMGVPVVTLVGKTIVGRAGVSLLSNLGMPELIAKSEDDFVNIATTLAHDLPALAAIRARLRKKMQDSILMDGKRFTQKLETAFRDMWCEWCNS